jgi:transposase
MRRGKRGPQQRRSQGPWIVDDDLWAKIEPLLPVRERPAGTPGRKPFDDRKALCGILFVLYTGIPWQWLPQELGFGCGMTCWRRLRDWNDAGVWQALHEVLLAELRRTDRLDLERAVVDSAHLRALRGGPKPVGAR